MTIMVTSSNVHYWPPLNFSLKQSKVKKGLGVKAKLGLISPLYHLTLGPMALRAF